MIRAATRMHLSGCAEHGAKEFSMNQKINLLFGLLAAAGACALSGQTPPPAPRSAAATSVPAAPAPYAGKGVIRSLNYGPQGEVNGFVFESGIIALTPPTGTGAASVVKPGVSTSVSGLARTTPSGRTVVDVQTITVNGQTIAMNPAPPPPGGPGPRLDHGPGRGPLPAAPPPPARAVTPGPPPPAA